MKVGLSLLIALLLISTSAFGALSVDDLEKIREIVKESEDRLRAELTLVRAENAASEARTNEQLDRNLTLFVALFGFIAVIIGIPVTLVMLQTRKERDRDKQHNAQQQQLQEQQRVIETLQQQIESMNHELETLKQHSMFR